MVKLIIIAHERKVQTEECMSQVTQLKSFNGILGQVELKADFQGSGTSCMFVQQLRSCSATLLSFCLLFVLSTECNVINKHAQLISWKCSLSGHPKRTMQQGLRYLVKTPLKRRKKKGRTQTQDKLMCSMGGSM